MLVVPGAFLESESVCIERLPLVENEKTVASLNGGPAAVTLVLEGRANDGVPLTTCRDECGDAIECWEAAGPELEAAVCSELVFGHSVCGDA